MKKITLHEFMTNKQLAGRLFGKDSFGHWRTMAKILDGAPLNADDLALFQKCTGRTTPPTTPVTEFYGVKSRREGYTAFFGGLVPLHRACFVDYTPYLAPGERATIALVFPDRKQARVAMRYISGLLHEIPMIERLVERESTDSIDFTTRVTIEVHTASFRSMRGYTIAMLVADELAFWRTDDSANPDREIIDAVRPAMATIPGALIAGISSPYARRGVLWEAYRDHFGRDDSVPLVWQAPAKTMNPTLPQTVIDEAYARDPVSAAAEYGAQFRSDVAAFLDADWIARATVAGRGELAPRNDVSYRAFADPSGGSRDAFTLAIAHEEADGTLVLDVIRAVRPPFDPSTVVAEFAALLKTYGCHHVTGDRYAGQWVVEAFQKSGISYQHSERSKSEIYLEALPLFAQGRVHLLDHRVLTVELLQLERQTARGGRDTVDHPHGGHDDHANAACGALALLAKGAGISTEEIETIAKINAGATIRLPQPGAIPGTGSDLSRLIEQQRAADAANRGNEERPIDWLNEFL